jgi:hypothetical protein
MPGYRVVRAARACLARFALAVKESAMLALIAAVLFAIAFIINAAGIATDAVFAPLSLTFVGLALLAFHLTGNGPAWKGWRRR